MTDFIPPAPPTSFIPPAPEAAPEPVPAPASETASLKPVAKVAAAGVGGIVLVIVVGVLSGIAPDTFKDLGIWAPVVTAAVTALAAFLSGYIKKA